MMKRPDPPPMRVITRGVSGVHFGGFVTALILFALVVALSACAHNPPPPPIIVTKIQTVEKPIPVPCVDASDIPAEPAKVGNQLTGDAVNDASVLASALLDMRAVVEKTLGLLTACTK